MKIHLIKFAKSIDLDEVSHNEEPQLEVSYLP